MPELSADSIYFFMFPGWATEMRSNRWHYASRWAKHLPVVLLQPTQVLPSIFPDTHSDIQLANVRVLYIQSSRQRGFLSADQIERIQFAQIELDMRTHGVTRPIFWSYNPQLLNAFVCLPAAFRVYHATEDYFRFERLDPSFIDRFTKALNLSDLVIPVSSGVAHSIAKHARPQRIMVETNGCDFSFYEAATDRTERFGLHGLGTNIAVYAGNVNSRLNFELLLNACEAHPSTAFIVFGPVADLPADDRELWKRLLRTANFSYLGIASPEQLRLIYFEADVGLIPYRATPMIVESGFPLKALEMAASGLPVVTTAMNALRGLASGLRVTDSRREFIHTLGILRRQTLSDEVATELVQLARSQNYDEKFNRVVEIVSSLLERSATIAPVAIELGDHQMNASNSARANSELQRFGYPAPRHLNILRASSWTGYLRLAGVRLAELAIVTLRFLRSLPGTMRYGRPRLFDPFALQRKLRRLASTTRANVVDGVRR